MQVPKSWMNRPADISQSNWQILKSLYSDIRDIDLFTGSLAEDPIPNGMLGQTPTCIVADQFQRLMAGDRYFFSHGGNVGMGLNINQIKAVKSVRNNSYKPFFITYEALIVCLSQASILNLALYLRILNKSN